MSTITVEFLGLARILTQQKMLELQIGPATTYRDIVQIIGTRFPVLVGQVISPEGNDLIASNMISLNGEHMIQEDAMGDIPSDGDRIIFMSILAGG